MTHSNLCSFTAIIAYRDNAAMMHYAPSKETDVVLKEGGMLLSDTGGGYYEGSTDITRTTVLGHITPELKKYYTAVYRAMQHLSAANFLYGNHGWSLDVLARQPIWDILEVSTSRQQDSAGTSFLLRTNIISLSLVW